MIPNNEQYEEIDTKDKAVEEFESRVKKSQQNNSSAKSFRSEQKLFINARDSTIILFVIDKNNKQYRYNIPMGGKQYIDHVPSHIKKVVCRDKQQEKDIIIPQAILNGYSVFIFNFDIKPEQFHFVDVKQKTYALQQAKNVLRTAQLFEYYNKQLIEKLIKKVEAIENKTTYLQ